MSVFTPTQLELAKQILLTLGYSAQFRQPLTTAWLWRRLLLAGSPTQFQNVLIQLWRLGLVEAIGAESGSADSAIRWQLACLPASSLVSKQAALIDKDHQLAQVVAFVRWLPFVKALAVTGSVAAGSVRSQDDLDLMVIAAKNRLWLVRPLILLYAWSRGKRRSWHREEPGSWCFNLWLDESNLALQRDRQNLYSAFELCQARFVYDAGVGELSLRRRMLRANYWVKCLLPNFWSWSYGGAQGTSAHPGAAWRQILEVADVVLGPIWWPLNLLAYWAQSLYMKRHQTTEEVRLGAAFFHPRNTRSILYLGWRAVMSYWGTSSLRVFLESLGQGQPPSNCLSLEQAVELSGRARSASKEVVLVTGVFDLLHSAHLEFLQSARDAGSVLMVGLESDLRVRQMKGAGRPIFEEKLRQRRLAMVRARAGDKPLADGVFILPENFNTQGERRWLIERLRPQVLAVSTHSPHQEAKAKMMAEIGGELKVVAPEFEGVSSSVYSDLIFDRAGSRIRSKN